MNAREGNVFSNHEKTFGNGNGFMPIYFKNNSYHLSVSRSGKNNNTCGNSDAQMRKEESISKKLKPSPQFNLQEGDAGNSTSKEPNLLGLKLPRTPSFLNMMGNMSQEKKPRQKHEGSNQGRGQTFLNVGAKMKAGNFPASYIKIGAWQRIARNEGDLIVKLYYAKRKLVWEILEGALKNKMEIQWSDICAIRAVTADDEPGVLEIELIKPPVYYRETCPQPRKHTIWQQSYDFTGGQAPIWRRHLVTFPPGVLGKNYEKLLQCDLEFNAMSKRPFPRHKSPYFDPHLFETTLNFSGYDANKAARYPCRPYPTIIPRQPLFSATPNPSLQVLDPPFTYQVGGNYNFVAQNQSSWQQSFAGDNFGMNGTFGISSATATVNNVYDHPFSSTTNVNNVNDLISPSTTNKNNVYYEHNVPGPVNGIQTDFDNAQVDDAQTIGSIMGVNNNINESSYHPDMAFHVATGDQGSNINNYDLNGIISDSIHWLEAQGSSENVFQGLSENLGKDVFQGSNKGVFQGFGEDAFQGSCEDTFQGSGKDVFQGSGEDVFQASSENMFQLPGNNTKNVGVGGFFNQYPF